MNKTDIHYLTIHYPGNKYSVQCIGYYIDPTKFRTTINKEKITCLKCLRHFSKTVPPSDLVVHMNAVATSENSSPKISLGSENFKNSQGEIEMHVENQMRIRALEVEVSLVQKLDALEAQRLKEIEELTATENEIKEVKAEIKEGKRLRALIK